MILLYRNLEWVARYDCDVGNGMTSVVIVCPNCARPLRFGLNDLSGAGEIIQGLHPECGARFDVKLDGFLPDAGLYVPRWRR